MSLFEEFMASSPTKRTKPKRSSSRSSGEVHVPIPDTGWTAPREFPRLDSAKLLAIDCETYDPELLEKGPGWGRGVGHVVGVSVGTDDGHRWYFPMRHTVEPETNMDPTRVLAWLADALADARQPKIGANLAYDVGWLAQEGVSVAGQLIDVQYAEALLDEHRRSYSLDSLSRGYLDEGKVDSALYDWLHRRYGGKPGRPQAGNIYRAPPRLVGPYAEGDVDLPMRVWERQKPLLEEQDLMPLFRLETALIPIIVRMRTKGIRVDIGRAEQVREHLMSRVEEVRAQVKAATGVSVDLWAAESIARAFDAVGIDYPHTPKTGAPSFTADWLDHHPSEIATLIRSARKYDKAAATFVDSYVMDKAVNGRVHGEFHPLRSDDGGTIVGRFSSANPNLENIPARDPELGPMIRSIYLPEEGHRWTVYDYSQIQFRIMTHYAVGPGAIEARAKYNADPTTDYHAMAQALILENTGIELDRKPVKNINFGLAFTMGLDKLARQLGLSKAAAHPLIEAYHAGLPFVRATSDRVSTRAQERGYIVGVLGRRHRFPLWEPMRRADRKRFAPTLDADALVRDLRAAKLPTGIVRAYTHLGLNRLAQDGEGSTMKSALVACHRDGLFDVVGYPLNIVHDDVNFSNAGTPAHEEALAEIARVMRTTVAWKVPILVERSDGPNWGEVA